MNVAIKHNGTTITGFVTEYERVHKICTGIGTLNIAIVDTVGRTFKPWDSIDIYENGDYKVRYYVSSVEHNISRSTLVLDCQDNSKRIVDYFIPDSYTVDYPSYTRYWIEKFLDEAGVSYEFNTSSQGNLLSNFTQLGLTTVYEQIQTLLQMSGWYMFFDGNGKAIIGSLDVDFAEDFGSVGKTDILDILVTKDDKMLRNKALVFGAYDPYEGTNAKASVTVHTPWNYDHNDLRTVVISNSNIPDTSTAYGMANQIVKEFARITVEKHLTVWGARNFNLGTALRVTSNIWKGRGLITTFGVSMSSKGLVTNIVLDERCPRLFGFFDFGDYVYVAFYGDGVWRKHIKFDPTWYNFSTGLTNLAITDMHIKEGVFGAVGASGEPYYAIDDLPWHPLVLSGLMSSIDDNVDPEILAASGEVPMKEFTGLSARAVTIDKMTGTVKFAVDTASGVNYGDYFLEHSAVLGSGLIVGSGGTSTASGVMRSWIVEYDVQGGDIYGTPYPVSLSGNYGYSVIDLDNDGVHDYISVATSGLGIPVLGEEHNYGFHETQPFAMTKDYTSYTVYPSTDSIEKINSMYYGEVLGMSLPAKNRNSLIAYDNRISGKCFAMAIGSDNKARKITYDRTFNSGENRWDMSQTVITSSANGSLSSAYILGIYPDLIADTFKIYYAIGSYFASTLSFYYIVWDAYANTWGTQTLIQTTTKQGGTTQFYTRDSVTINDTIYCLNYYVSRGTTSGGYFVSTNHLYVDVVSIDMTTGSLSNDYIMDFQTPQFGSSGRYYYFPGASSSLFPAFEPQVGSMTTTILGIFQNGNEPQIIGRTEVFYGYISPDVRSTKEFVFYGNATTLQYNEIYSDTQNAAVAVRRFPVAIADRGCQLTETRGFVIGQGSGGDTRSYVFNGTVFYSYDSTKPVGYNTTNIYPVFANSNGRYIVYDTSSDSEFSLWNAETMAKDSDIVAPPGYWLDSFASTGIGTGTSIYASIYDVDFDYLCPYNFNSFDLTKRITGNIEGTFSTVPGFNRKTVNFGNFFLEDAGDYSVSTPYAGVYYMDLGNPANETTIYQVLQRSGDEYKLIQQEIYPIRVDISGNAPVLTVGSGESTFQSNYVYETELVTVQAVPSGAVVASGGNQVTDYRYTYLQPMIGLIGSGGISSTILYVSGSGIFSADALTYSGGFTQMFSIPSGEATRIETSNYGNGGQYIFVTASGFAQTFYQQDPASYYFSEYQTGFPQTRATIIRLDDVI